MTVNRNKTGSFSMVNSHSIQLGKNGKLRHFLTIEGLNREIITEILDTAESFAGVAEQSVKRFPCYVARP